MHGFQIHRLESSRRSWAWELLEGGLLLAEKEAGPAALYFFIALTTFLLSACASTSEKYRNRPFFLAEEQLQTHGRKSWLDRIIETDPGQTDYSVASDYQTNPPLRIAVLPFVDHGNGDFLINKIPLSFHTSEELDRSAWTHANRVRRSISGEIGGREFEVVPLMPVDAVLADRGIKNWDKLMSVRPEQLGRWLDVQAVVYGEILGYEAYWAGLISIWRVGARMAIVSTTDGHKIFTARNDRYSVDLSPALDPIDMGINSAFTLVELRDITLARTEYEVVREMVLRLPVAHRNVSYLRREAIEKERDLDIESEEPNNTNQRLKSMMGLSADLNASLHPPPPAVP